MSQTKQSDSNIPKWTIYVAHMKVGLGKLLRTSRLASKEQHAIITAANTVHHDKLVNDSNVINALTVALSTKDPGVQRRLLLSSDEAINGMLRSNPYLDATLQEALCSPPFGDRFMGEEMVGGGNGQQARDGCGHKGKIPNWGEIVRTGYPNELEAEKSSGNIEITIFLKLASE